jgi:hypothetical protein
VGSLQPPNGVQHYREWSPRRGLEALIENQGTKECVEKREILRGEFPLRFAIAKVNQVAPGAAGPRDL